MTRWNGGAVRSSLLGLAISILAVGLLAAVPRGAGATSGCTKVAAPGGSDDGPGTSSAPYRTLQRLADSLHAGQTGCLRQGSYGGGEVYLDQPGATLTSYPGERARITAFVEVEPEAVHARLTHLSFDTTGNPNITGTKLQADGAVFSDNEVTKGGRGICLLAGTQHAARGIVIERNHIYGCGRMGSKYEHQIYLVHTRGAIVRWNVLDGNRGGWGVQLYTDADGTLIEHNLIDGNYGGVVFAGDGHGDTSDHNVVRNNAITFQRQRGNIEGSWSGGPRGVGNSAHHNCLYKSAPSKPSGLPETVGFSTYDNTVLGGSPYVNRARGDYRFRATSPCARLVGNVAGPTARVSRVRSARRGSKVVLHSTRARIRPAQRWLLTGRVTGARPWRAPIKLQRRGRHGWRTIARARPAAGRHFIALVRAAHRKGPRIVRLRALVPGVGRSRAVRVLVAR
jgi:hypothetical protein